MGYVLYGDRRSGSCAVEAALALIGVPWEDRGVDLGSDAQRGSAYATLNPSRKLPALITPDGEILTESVAILLTLDERHRDARLLPPPGSAPRAVALRWLLFVATELYPVVEVNDYPERFAPDVAMAPAIRRRAQQIWRDRWGVVEAQIGGDPWLLPGGPCLTDLYIAVVSRWAQQDAWRPAHLPKVEGLAAAVAAMDRVRPVWSRHFGAAPQ